jgi:hypothetical protein
MDSIILEAANPPVFEWYVKNYGNLFVDRVRSFSANACGGAHQGCLAAGLAIRMTRRCGGKGF